MNKPSTLLKVISIIFIIFGIIALIASALAIVGGGALAVLGAGSVGALVIVAGLIGIVGGIVMLVGGVMGNKAKNLKACFTIGIVILVFQIAGIALNIASTGFSPIGLVGVVLTILYILGVKQTEQGAA